MAGEKETFVIFGVENQSEIDYSMPVRCLFMDMMDYVNQIERIAKKHRAENSNQTGAEFISGFHKSDKLYPVVTAVILECKNIEQACSGIGFYNSLIIQHQI